MRSPRTLVLRGGRIRTLDEPGEVEAIALRDGRILALGSEAEVASAVGEAPRVDLGGRTVLPGFTDAHLHWTAFALARRRLGIPWDDGLADVQRRVRAAATELPAGRWILGRGWDHRGWGRWPEAQDLDAAAPDHPVALTRKDGHVLWVNGAAMRAVGIDAETLDPEGGEIARDAQGRPIGILKENAKRLVLDALPEVPPEERQAAIVEAWPEAWCRGLTGVHDMGHGRRSIFRDLAVLRDAGSLGLRFVWYLPRDELDRAIGMGLRSGLGDEWMRVGGLKLFLDGTLGSQTADMLAPYEDQPDNRGLEVMDGDTFLELIDRAARAGLATAVHAIGDRANRRALDGFQTLREGLPSASALRMRIEHAQLLAAEDLPRFARLGVTASMQPIHATADMEAAERHWGARSALAYAWRGLREAGADLAFGSDAPIEPLDVFAGIYAAVARRRPGGDPPGGWHPEQRVELSTALRAYTRGAAAATGQESLLGSLAAGKCADLIVLDRDPLAVPTEQLPALGVQATMIEGVWVWQRPDVELGGPRQG